MSMVSVTAVGAFDAVGSILVVALMITPPAAAYLLTDRLSRMLGLSVLLAAGSALGGFWLARVLDANIAGSMATTSGIIFALSLLFAPQRGMISLLRRRMRQKWNFAQTMLIIHLLNHENTAAARIECRVDHLWEHLRWQPDFAEEAVRFAERKGAVRRQSGILYLTEDGREQARQAMVH